jgi:hypothetical protein
VTGGATGVCATYRINRPALPLVASRFAEKHSIGWNPAALLLGTAVAADRVSGLLGF